MKKFRNSELTNLTAKPSDYRPGRYEQLTIDDELIKTKVVSKMICDICEGEYDVYERVLNNEFVTWEHDYVRIEQRRGDKQIINSFNICPTCSTCILNFIKNMKQKN